MDEVIARAQAAGIVHILVPGWDIASSWAAIELAERHSDIVDAAVGVHPHRVGALSEADWDDVAALVRDPRSRAVGEIGLDFFRNLSTPDEQRDGFSRQLALAAAAGRPVLVHDRDAHREVTATLLAWAGPPGRPVRGVLHAFSGDAEMATRLIASGYLVSFALPVTFRTAIGPRATVPTLADGTFLVETDAPYLGPDRSRRNEPTTTLRVCAELAALRDLTPAELVAPIGAAYERLVGGR